MRALTLLALLAILFPLFSTPGSTGAGSASPLTTQDPAALPPVELEPVLADLDQPVYVTGARDGSNRLFIVERPGRIKVLLPGDSAPRLFLDITDQVGLEGERGLLCLAFHPQFQENRRLFISYTRNFDGALVIAEYHTPLLLPNVAETHEEQILVIPQPSDLHHSGMLAFGPDGYLYISTGDGLFLDPENDAQNPDNLRGKMLRIDVDHANGDSRYSSPVTNPFFGNTPGGDEIYALGFRNPWRFSFDRVTGQLYVGDVGQDVSEEINLVTAGGNYGWRVFEGDHCSNIDPDACNTVTALSPLIEYQHNDGRCAVTGGYVYRGAAASLPAGAYVFGDFCTGEIFLWHEGAVQLLLDTDLKIASFGEDDNGEIYVVGIGGSIERIASPLPAVPPLEITSVQVRKRNGGKVLNPVTVKPNGKKFDVVITGTSFAAGAVVLAGGRELVTEPGVSPDTELIARLRADMLAQPGALVIEVVNPDGNRSNSFTITIQ